MDEDAERQAMIDDPTGFEREFNFDCSQLVKFPSSMGISGFAYQNDGVCYINGLQQAFHKSS